MLPMPKIATVASPSPRRMPSMRSRSTTVPIGCAPIRACAGCRAPEKTLRAIAESHEGHDEQEDPEGAAFANLAHEEVGRPSRSLGSRGRAAAMAEMIPHLDQATGHAFCGYGLNWRRGSFCARFGLLEPDPHVRIVEQPNKLLNRRRRFLLSSRRRRK